MLGTLPAGGGDAEFHQVAVGPAGFYLLATDRLVRVGPSGTLEWTLGRTGDRTSVVGGAQGVAAAPSGLVGVTFPAAGAVRWFGFYVVANAPARLVHLGSSAAPLLICDKPVVRRLRITRSSAGRAGWTNAKVTMDVSQPVTLRLSVEHHGRGLAAVTATAGQGRAVVDIGKRFDLAGRPPDRYELVVDATDASGNRARRRHLDFSITGRRPTLRPPDPATAHPPARSLSRRATR